MNSPRPPSSQRISLFPLSFPNNRPSGHQHQPDTQTLSPSSTDDSRSPSQPSPDLSRSSSVRSARQLSSSLLPALRLAGLAPEPDQCVMRSSRPRDQAPKPKPLLVLKLSSSSFLDTVIRDDKSKDPIYILETANDLTPIYRLDHPRDEPIKAATIQWPVHPVRTKGKSGRSVQFGAGSWRDAEDILKSGPLGNTAIRKFNIPHYPNSLKWKLIPGNCFCCVTSAVKGPVAVLDAATLSAPPRIKIYDTLIDKETARSQDNYKGIPTILLDYLVVTAFLLVTDVQEWLDRPREARIPGSNSYTVQRWLALIHHTPAPPEPDHPTVDLSLTVPSTPPQSATFPSPGGFWETQSGVTSLSGSNGSGSGASYLGDPFTPTTPATPATPATSAYSSLYSRSVEDVPPVPPVPGSSSGGSPFAWNVDSQARERHKSTPHTTSHSPSSSTSTAQAPAASNTAQAEADEDYVPAPRARPPQTLSLPANVHSAPSLVAASMSTSAPTSPYPGHVTVGRSTSSASRPPRRQLPTPPVPAPANSFAQPWLYHSSSSTATPSAAPSTSTPVPDPSGSSTAMPSTPISATSSSSRARASMRGSLRTTPIPPPPPPPQHSIPLPPKLAQEQQGYASRIGPRPHTAPEFENANRRRHSAGEFGELGPEGASSSSHPYATAGRDTDGLVGHMHGLRISTTSAGPSQHGGYGHIRAPSQPAPDYDTHSFVGMPPPVPPLPPLPQPGLRSPPPGRRVLTVVNADATTMPAEDPGRCLPSDRGRARMSYAESVYEMPPPAYDAIDFSVPPVPPAGSSVPTLPPLPHMQSLPPIMQGQPLHVTPLPVPPIDTRTEGHRERLT
ncbi:hypothetical protein C8Q76DRAFT_808294 [Earliella scabrosa]|nr:hypothetical protein C8Q76DRAFT_808294 [Earliella scabrosa]